MKKKKKSVKNHLEIMLNLINIRQTVTIKFRVGIKSVSQKWKIMGKLMHDISEGKLFDLIVDKSSMKYIKNCALLGRV